MKERILVAILVIGMLLGAAVVASADDLETTSREVTWYTGLSSVHPTDGNGVYGTSTIGQMWLPSSVRDETNTSVTWQLVYVSGPDNFELSYVPYSDQYGQDWTDRFFFAEAKPKSDTLTLGTSVYIMKATYKGVTYEGTLKIHTENPSSIPTGIVYRVYESNSNGDTIGNAVAFSNGAVTVTEGQDYYLSAIFEGNTPDNNNVENHWLNSDFHEGGAVRKERWSETSDTVRQIYWANSEHFTAKDSGTYTAYATLTIGDTNLEAVQSFKLRVADENGKVPSVELKLKNVTREANIYLGLDNYGNGIGSDSIGVWCDRPWLAVYFNDYDKLEKAFHGEPLWTIKTSDGTILYSGSGYEDSNQGVLEYEVNTFPSQAGNVEYIITCEWGDQKDTVSSVFSYIQLNTLPTGHNYPATVNLQVGDTFAIEPSAEPAGWSISGQYFHTYVIDDFLSEFAEYDKNASTNTKKVYKATKAGVCSATVLLQTDTISIGKETFFRIADDNGNVPKPEVRIDSWYELKRSYWIAPGTTPGSNEYGKILGDDFIDQLSITNETVCRSELNGNPVWSISSNQYLGLRETGDGFEEVYLKKMPSTAMDVVVDITCTWDGQTTTMPYTVHFETQPVSLPTAVKTIPENCIIVARVGEQFDYDIRFKNGDGLVCHESFYRSLSDNLQNEFGWDLTPTRSGIFEGYMETGVDNLYWREKLTIVVAKANGTLKADDYTPFGTVATVSSDLIRIDSQAFAGTSLTEVDIPAGVSIAADAFDGTGLIAVYTHNDRNTIQWAVSNGFVALTE